MTQCILMASCTPIWIDRRETTESKKVLPDTPIEVTAKHIEMGKKEDCRLCPVALAIADRFGIEHGGIRVEPNRTIADGGLTPEGLRAVDYRVFKNPWGVETFVGRFDTGQSVEPFTFQFPRAYFLQRDL